LEISASDNRTCKEDYFGKGNGTIKELVEETQRSQASVRRAVSNLLEKGSIERVGGGKDIRFVIKK